MSLAQTLGGLPPAALIALGVLAVAQLCLQVLGLLDLARRDEVAGGRRWVWALVIVAGGIVGAAVYLAVGRTSPRAHAGEVRSGGESATRRAIDDLYGPGDHA